ncbi:hypothetical protein [Thalassomonas actiniarum]|uniref:Esterase n=1 Tax=Thalassomonas actiniarum TaxID=485447 RepID=A0AAE9YN20_9GAMM|nr:hypothetical protein [Thalassomonas actiniarum]WDD98164.1 hypothetical protein SG35_023250 [Thalassomonas actiniarum]
MKHLLTLAALALSFNIQAATSEFDVQFVDLDDYQVAARMATSNATSLADKKLIVYANGMNNPLEQITRSFNALQSTLMAQNPITNTEYQVAYNYSEGIMTQGGQVLAQHFYDGGAKSWSDAWKQAAWAFFHPGRFATEKVLEIISNYGNDDVFYTDNDLSIHINNLYLPKINNQYKVVIVAHSQGNFYANLAWENIQRMPEGVEKSKAMGIIGVAVPTTRMADGRNRYITNSNDLIMNAIRSNSSPAYKNLPATHTYPFTSDLTGHGLTDTYLQYASFKSLLNSYVTQTFSELVPYQADDTITCGQALSRSGGYEGLTNLPYYLGEEDGEVMVSFEAFHVPDSYTIKNQHGQTKASSNGLTSGFSFKRFDYDYQHDGTLRVNVSGSASGTVWEMMVGCPNQNISIGRTSYDFHFENHSMWTCEFDLMIDGDFKSHIRAGYNVGWDTAPDIYLTPGEHEVTYANKHCTANNLCTGSSCSFEFGAKAVDGWRTITLPSPVNTNSFKQNF